MKGAYGGDGQGGAMYWIYESRFDFSVPEPASTGLVGGGMLAMGILVQLRRRRG
jgi:hypothetical protein